MQSNHSSSRRNKRIETQIPLDRIRVIDTFESRLPCPRLPWTCFQEIERSDTTGQRCPKWQRDPGKGRRRDHQSQFDTGRCASATRTTFRTARRLLPTRLKSNDRGHLKPRRQLLARARMRMSRALRHEHTPQTYFRRSQLPLIHLFSLVIFNPLQDNQISYQ
jgi:hypothetical protein